MGGNRRVNGFGQRGHFLWRVSGQTSCEAGPHRGAEVRTMIQPTGRVTEVIRLALQTIWGHKLRSCLTVLGIVIGILGIIIVSAFVQGLNSNVRESISSLGSDTIT